MSRLLWRQALWALVLVNALAPSSADGNIGCLFSSALCVDGVEWCYDDFAFGKCIPIYEEEPEEGSLYRYDMDNENLKWFENELQLLVRRGFKWGHAYTQCVLQAMLFTLREKLDPDLVKKKVCDPFQDLKMETNDIPDLAQDQVEIDPDNTAFIRFTPNLSAKDSNYANEIFSPPLDDDDPDRYLPPPDLIPDNLIIGETENLNGKQDLRDQFHDYILMKDDEPTPIIIEPFGGFRERIQAEQKSGNTKIPNKLYDKEKKSISPLEPLNESDGEERIGAHYRKHKLKVPPYTAEYLTANRFSPLDAEFRSNALEKYKESFAAKHFPFEYENPDNEISEPRVYFDEDGMDNFSFDEGSGDLDPNFKDHGDETDAIKNMQYLLNFWKQEVESKLKPEEALYAEGGPLRPSDFQGTLPLSSSSEKRHSPGSDISDTDNVSAEKYKYYSEDLPRFLYNEWGFKRRERDDVKKPGPRLDAKTIKSMHQKNVTEPAPIPRKWPISGVAYKPSDYNHDPSFAYVKFKQRVCTNWDKGVELIKQIEKMLELDEHTFTSPRVAPDEVTFKVEKNSKGLSAEDIATQLGAIKDRFQKLTGVEVVDAGVGDRIKRPVLQKTVPSGTQVFGLELPVLLALIGSCAVLVSGTVVFAVLLKKDMNAKRKMHGLATASEIDAEATNDYQELCRARMSGKWSGTGPQSSEHPQRITSLSKEPDGNSPSTRSSTSSWSEEPALTNMDISTGHMVLAYMEDHLRNKDRLEQEWQALCAYEAEPCATVAALKPENKDKNRYTDVLPYDHSRVSLNTLTNHLSSDYINASTITDHDPRNPAYIAAAGPLANTAPDFWQMVWEQGSVVMVMLTRLTENGTQLCHRYWPEEGSELYHIYEVHLVSEHIWCDDYLVRSFYLKNQRTGETRTVTQFHFLSWPENGVPSSTKALLEFRRKVNKSYRGRSCPIVVHCSDGAGRSGTYCLIDMVLNRMAKGAKEIDIAATLEHIRDQRARTVATKQQFEFVLMAVAEEVHAILKALPAHLQQLQEKKDKEKEKDATDKETK